MATVLNLLRLFSVFVHYNILFYFSKFSFLFYDKKDLSVIVSIVKKKQQQQHYSK